MNGLIQINIHQNLDRPSLAMIFSSQFHIMGMVPHDKGPGEIYTKFTSSF